MVSGAGFFQRALFAPMFMNSLKYEIHLYLVNVTTLNEFTFCFLWKNCFLHWKTADIRLFTLVYADDYVRVIPCFWSFTLLKEKNALSECILPGLRSVYRLIYFMGFWKCLPIFPRILSEWSFVYRWQSIDIVMRYSFPSCVRNVHRSVDTSI